MTDLDSVEPVRADMTNTATQWRHGPSRRRRLDEGPGYQQTVETLDMDAATRRLHEAITERPDASLRCWLDVALNGWPDDDEREAEREREQGELQQFEDAAAVTRWLQAED
jgi:hypothetical protein